MLPAFVNAVPWLVWGLVVHFIVDFFFQNTWMVEEKTDLKKAGGWVHAGSMAAGMLWVFPPPVAVIIGLTHLLIDTRKPLAWWRKEYGQSTDGPAFIPFAMWQDQVAHILVIALAALWMAR